MSIQIRPGAGSSRLTSISVTGPADESVCRPSSQPPRRPCGLRCETTDVSTWTPDSSSWTQLSTRFTTGSATSSVTVYLHGWYGQAAYYADDVSVFGPDGGGGTDTPTVPSAPGGLKGSAPKK